MGPCDTAKLPPSGCCPVHDSPPVRRGFGPDGRSRRARGRMLVGWGGDEQCLQWAETATDRTKARTGCRTRNRTRPSASGSSAERARIPVANSTGVSTTSPNTVAVVASACTATTVGTLKETIDHGRGVAVTSPLAVVCCSTKCWYQRSRTSRAAAAAFDYTFGYAFGFASAPPSATLLYSILGVLSCF